jgi:hypothetical protein
MEKSKIKTLNFNRVYSGKNGEVTVYNATMENGQFGELHTTKDKYKVGDEINYELDSRQYNGNTVWSIKVKTPPTASFVVAKTDPNREISIVRQSCLKAAVELCVGGKINVEQLLISADKFVEWVNKK